jgi:protein-tyrosine-phosphatase
MVEKGGQLLFVGGQDASCSAMAAAFARAYGRANVAIRFAGVQSGTVDPLVRRVLTEVHIQEDARNGARVADLGTVSLMSWLP